MGANLSNAIKSIDGSSDAEKETKDALNSLFELGKSRNEAAFAHATSDAMKVYAPVQKLLLQRQSIIASASNNTDSIVTGIKSAVGNLMKGQILDGVTDLIGNALNVVLGSSSGQISQSYTYALVATDLGALLRIDVDVYSFEIYSKGLQNHAKNMTAITSLVSTVNPNGLTLSDIRGVVSMSYGNSPIELQQKIFDLVRSAWENDRKVSVGQALSSADHEKFVSYIVPSKYEESMKTRGVLGLPAHSPQMPPKKMIGRDELTGALQNNRAARAKSQGISLSSLGDDKPRMLDLFILFHLVDTFDGTWLNHMGGALKGFEIAGAFQYVGVSGGRSGSAISFQCQANAELETFETTIAYCKHTVIPAIRKAEYLSSNVASVSMQYSHPGTGDSGISSKIVFKSNTITNATGDIITFHASEQSEVLLTLQPKEARALSGSLSYITGSPPADAATQPNGEAPKETEAAKPTTKAPNDEKPKNEKPKEWVTYQSFAPHDILTGMPAELIKLSNGYQVNINGPQDVMLQIKYNSEWPSGS